MDNPIREISRIIKNNRSFLVASHVSPDGDAIGSTAAMGFLLRALGKDVILYNPSGLPDRYAWLPLPGPLTAELPAGLPEWTIVLDCGADDRFGNGLGERLVRERTVNIDHHLGNPDFGAVNWVDPTQPAVGAMVARLARELSVPLTGGLAQAVYLAVTTDTGHFTYGNTTPEVLELTAAMLRDGLDLEGVNASIENQWTLGRMELWRRAMGTLSLRPDGLVARAVITQADLAATGTRPEDCEEIINFVRRIKGLRVCAVIRENKAGIWKISLRSRGADDVQKVAASFGGGGHRNAAGCSITAPLPEVLARLDAAVAAMPGLEATS